jgi:hypothetical protein
MGCWASSACVHRPLVYCSGVRSIVVLFFYVLFNSCEYLLSYHIFICVQDLCHPIVVHTSRVGNDTEFSTDAVRTFPP